MLLEDILDAALRARMRKQKGIVESIELEDINGIPN
jgi:hypothetical protein